MESRNRGTFSARLTIMMWGNSSKNRGGRTLRRQSYGQSLGEILSTPSWKRVRLIRMCAAMVCLALAALLWVHSVFSSPPRTIVLAHFVERGVTLQPEDVTSVVIPEGVLPPGSPHSVEEVVGKIAVVDLLPNDVPTNNKLLDTRLLGVDDPSVSADSSSTEAGGGLSLVPITVSDPGVAPLLVHGARVTVVQWSDQEESVGVVAENGRIVVVLPGGEHESPRVLVALPREEARLVAGMSLAHRLSVVVEGY